MMYLSILFVCLCKIVASHDSRHIEMMMPMRDGVKLQTLIFLPRNTSDTVEKYTAIVDRSPYGYGDMEWITDIFLPFGFAAVGQDMRGTALSEGDFSMWQSDANDSQDLGDWIVSQEWSNGEIMLLGASADGIGALQTPINNPSWLSAQYIIWAPSSMYDILFPNGAYKQETTESWLTDLFMRHPWIKPKDIEIVHINEAHTDYWRNIEGSPEVWGNVRGKTAFWGGWYDLFITGTLTAFDGYNNFADESVRHTAKITVDPLGHCLDGANFFTENVVLGRTLVVLGQMFEVYGIRPVSRNNIKNVTFYVMSSNDESGKEVGQFWTSLEAFPEFKSVEFFLHGDGSASRLPPVQDDLESSSFTVDPANPVPTVGGNNLCPDIGGTIPCGPMDQSEVDTRDDVLVFQTEPMSEPLYITGPLFATLFVSSLAVDTDFMVKISDLYPTGEAILIQDSALRMRWRDGGLEPVYIEADKVYQIDINLWNTSWVIAPGHALRFSVSSSNWPRFSVNPHNGLLLKDRNYPGENITTTNTVYHSIKYHSKITLPVVQKHQLPVVHVMNEILTSYPQLTEDVVQKFSDGLIKRMKRQ